MAYKIYHNLLSLAELDITPSVNYIYCGGEATIYLFCIRQACRFIYNMMA